MAYTPGLTALTDRLIGLCAPSRRVIVGLVGEPGAGKSTVAGALVEACLERGLPTALVPMDGFHLANVELARQGIAERKGAPDTFDAGGYAALLARLRTATERVYAPIYDRSVEESIANALPVDPDVRLVITEGNYLLLDGPWEQVRTSLDEVWAVRVDGELRRQRLVRRHERFGKPAERARAWVDTVDEPNAALIAATFGRVDLEIWEQSAP